MKGVINRKALITLFAATAAIFTSLSLASCHNANASKESAQSSLGDPRPDKELDRLMRALADGDAAGFASLCV